MLSTGRRRRSIRQTETTSADSRVAANEAYATAILGFRVGREALRELVIALFKDDHVAEAAGTCAEVRGDLLDVLFDFLACAERVTVEDAGFGLLPVIGEIWNSKKASNMKPGSVAGSFAARKFSLRSSARSMRRRRSPAVKADLGST
jgi:hypothetical protein